MKLPHILVVPLVLINLISCKKEQPEPVNTTPPIEDIAFASFELDSINRLILYNGNSIEIINNKLVIDDSFFQIKTTDKELVINKEYLARHNGKNFKMFLTELPIISIHTYGKEVIDEPKIVGKANILENGKEPFSCDIGIELRGGFSQSYPKKSYSIELWKTKSGYAKEKVSLLGMRVDDDWILDAQWNEPNRVRDFTSHELWLKMGRVQNQKEHSKIGIERKYCEVFVNGSYKGVYYLGEKLDRKQLDLDKNEGELYKGVTWADGVTYTGLEVFDNSSIEWSGYETKYPDQIGVLDWSHLHTHIDFVVNSSVSDFTSVISSKIDMDNAIDYYIFLNLIYATDNTGKNVYTCKFDQSSPYFFIPWDMDGSFGNNHAGDRSDITTQMLSNGLYDRLLDMHSFKNQVKKRWIKLRTNILSNNNIKQMFRNNYEYLEHNGVYKREEIVIELTQNYSNTEIDFIESWVDRRILFLDNHFHNW